MKDIIGEPIWVNSSLECSKLNGKKVFFHSHRNGVPIEGGGILRVSKKNKLWAIEIFNNLWRYRCQVGIYMTQSEVDVLRKSDREDYDYECIHGCDGGSPIPCVDNVSTPESGSME